NKKFIVSQRSRHTNGTSTISPNRVHRTGDFALRHIAGKKKEIFQPGKGDLLCGKKHAKNG
ncbi:MAG TPA: hypothetical protein PKV53_10480, partial [Anaerohalosphaeraceae bacterium]|nr:hypothetical protein [Anaerohalosphaeraceae bacterium]